MNKTTFPDFDETLDLKLEKTIALTPAQVWKAYTNPELLKQWFCPVPWKVTECQMDLRPGGVFYTVMKGPEGEGFPTTGCFLAVEENKKLIWTDALLPDFRPSEKSFMTAIITFEETAGGTKYTAIAKHKNATDRKSHEDMGFVQGWSATLEQMVLMKNQ